MKHRAKKSRIRIRYQRIMFLLVVAILCMLVCTIKSGINEEVTNNEAEYQQTQNINDNDTNYDETMKEQQLSEENSENEKNYVFLETSVEYQNTSEEILIDLQEEVETEAEDSEEEQTTETEVETEGEMQTQEEPQQDATGPVLSAIGPSENYYYQLTHEDMVLIAKVVYIESGGECFEGKVAVAAVILNRYFYGGNDFDRKSIYSIITQPGQLADISWITQDHLDQIPDCMQAVEAACKGWDPTRAIFPNGALYFYNPQNVTGYQAQVREGIEVLTIGNHNFHVDFNIS